MRNTTVVILALAAVLLAGLAFRETSAARHARTALATAVEERDGLRERLARLEEEQKSLTSQNASLRSAATSTGARPPPDTMPVNKPFTTAVARGRMPRPMEALDSPEMRQLMAIEQKGRLDGRYAALFKALRLSPDQLDRFKQLLVDKQNTAMDVMAVAHRQDLLSPGSGADLATMVKKEQDVVDSSIRSLLGETAYEEYQDYERTRSQRGVVDQLASRLSYTDAPLSPQQAEALVDLLAAERSTQPQPVRPDPAAAGMRVAIAAGGGDTMVSFGPMGGDGAPISDASLAGAQTVLSEAQLSALRQLQAEQQAQQQMSELLRRSMPMPMQTSAPAQGAAWVATPGDPTAAPRP
jgi:hypothetical protein